MCVWSRSLLAMLLVCGMSSGGITAAAPNQFLNPDGTQDGLDADLCGAIGAKLGAKVEWANLAFPGLVPGLQAPWTVTSSVFVGWASAHRVSSPRPR